MSALVGDKDSLQEQVEELEQRLQDARLQLAVRGKSRMSTVVASDLGDKSKLGSTVFAEVLVNGVPTRTLIDTGSPATIGLCPGSIRREED